VNILFTGTAFYPSIGGAQVHWYVIAKYLADRGHDVAMLSVWQDNRSQWLLGTTLFAPRSTRQSMSGGLLLGTASPTFFDRVAMLPFLPFFFAAPEAAVPPIARRLMKAFLRALAGRTVDVVHSIRIGREHLDWASFFLAKELGVPFFITPNISPRMLAKGGKWVMRHFFDLLRHADGVFAFTQHEYEVLVELGVAPNRIARLGLGPVLGEMAGADLFRSRYGVKGHVVLFLGQKLPYKGFTSLLEAAPIVWRRKTDVTFVFMGPHYGRSRRIIRRAARDPRIIDIEAVPPFGELKASALAACDVLCVPSMQEGLGGVYLEAWVMGKPVIACDIPAIRDVVVDGEDGFLVRQEAREIAERIIWILEHPDVAAAMGRRGQEKVAEKYSWRRAVDTVEQRYRAALTAGRLTCAAPTHGAHGPWEGSERACRWRVNDR